MSLVGLAAPVAILVGSPGLADVGGEVGIGHQTVRQGHHPVRMEGVGHGVGKNAAVRLAADGAEVSVFVCRGSTDECDIDLVLTCHQGPDTAAVAAHVGQALELAVGDSFTDLASDARGADVGDGAVLDVGDDVVVGLAQGGCADGDVLQAHLVDGVHDHVDHLVAFTEVVVEADGHAVMGVAEL